MEMILDVARMPPVDEGAFAVRVIEFDLRFRIGNGIGSVYFLYPSDVREGNPPHGEHDSLLFKLFTL